MTFVRSKIACDVASYDPVRLNEDIARGDYPCAPQTRGGSARMFGIFDVCALVVYAQLVRLGLTKRVAGGIATNVLKGLREEGADRVDFPLTGFNSDPVYQEAGSAPAFQVLTGGEIIRALTGSLCFDLKNLLREVHGRLNRSGEND